MRIGKRGFQGRIKGNLHIQFGEEQLTSCAGLELVRRFLAGLGFFRSLQRSEQKLSVGGDFSFCRVVLTVLAMLLAGAKRPRHLEFLRDDPLVLRFAGLSRAPTERSLARSMRRMSHRTWPELQRLSLLVVRSATQCLDLRRWTLDIDGSVLSTGLQAERAAHGFNPHHKKSPSYYPILATLAQTGHVIEHLNRRGNVHDCYRSAAFLRDTVRTARGQLGLRGILEVRADGAFFKRDFLATCDSHQLQYSIKVPKWPWLNLRRVVKNQRNREWQWVDRRNLVQGLFATLPIPAWNRTERIAIYRKQVHHRPARGQQLDLFDPDDGDWEYSVVATNKTLNLRALWHFQNGRGVQEKTIGELKTGYAFASIPSATYRANTAWQKLNILAHNVMTSLQLMTTATERPRTLKRTALYLLRSVNTLRFEWLSKAARLLRPRGKPVLRLACNEATRKVVELIQQNLADAA